MSDNNKLPSPNQVLGNNKASKLPSPQEAFAFKSPQLREGDINIVAPKYTTPQDLAVDSAINFIKEKGGRNGSIIMDSELDVLKDVLKDPRVTKEQREKAILTIQGYDPKHDDSNTMYYNKLEDNGVYVPTALAYGEKPPKGYKVASVWGNQKEAENDSWWQDLGKSFANGVLGASQGVIDLAQVGTTMATGEESKYLNKLSNTAEALKFKKDSELNTPILNTEGITQWSDLLDKDRFDLSPKALWGAFNTAAESLTEFGGGVKGVVTAAKSGKGFMQGLKGVGKEFIDENGIVQNAINLSDKANKAAIFTGSFMSQLGDNLDNAEAAGLKGRDKAAVASAITAPMAALDAFWGLDGKVMSQLFQNEKRNLLKNVIKSVEKDAAGNITENGFKQLAKEMTIGYTDLAKKGVKEIVGDVISEGSQEAAQDFVQKAGEQLWDKMTPDERGQFGTDAFNAKSFGDYINSFATGLVAGAPMAVGTQVLRNKHDEQSLNAYERVKQGTEAVTALKTDLAQALKNNDINQSEYDQAIFKIDSYDKYHQETKDVNLKPEDEKKAFELSFQIQGLKTEIPTNENEISKLEPINRAKVESKQKQVKELQSELNDIIRRGELKAEPVVPKKEEEKIAKEKEQEVKDKTEEFTRRKKEAENNAKLNQKEEKKAVFEVHEKPVNPPKFTEDKRSYDEIPADEFNNHFFNARTIHRVLRKKLSSLPKQEMIGKLFAHEYSYKKNGKEHNNRTIKVQLEDGRVIKLASSKIREDSLLSGHTHTENIKEISTKDNYKGEVPPVVVGVKVVDLNDTKGYEMPEGYSSKKKLIKVYNKENGKFISWVKETNSGREGATDKEGKELYNSNEKELMEHLKTIREDVNPADLEEAMVTPIKPVVPVRQRAEEATKKIVEEAKKQVAESKPKKETTKDKFKKAVDLFYKTKEAEGGGERRNRANERKKFLEENPDIKYIDDNIKEIFNQLSEQNLITKEGNCP